MKYILNTPVLTTYGTFKFRAAEVEEARAFVAAGDVTSAVGHAGTAQLLSWELGREVPANRTAIKMAAGDTALILRVVDRLPEGKVLTKEELAGIRREYGILTRIE